MAKTRKIHTNWSKGEVSPKLRGRPDLVAYGEGAEVIENFLMLRQASLTRRPGLRFVAEVKDSSTDTIIFPFEAGLSNSYIIEVGSEYFRFYKNKARLEATPGVPVEIASPYNDSNIRGLHFTQSVDILFLFHALYRQRRLNKISDLNWSLIDVVHRPPPSFEKDTDISDVDLPPLVGGGQGIENPGGGQVGGGGPFPPGQGPGEDDGTGGDDSGSGP